LPTVHGVGDKGMDGEYEALVNYTDREIQKHSDRQTDRQTDRH